MLGILLIYFIGKRFYDLAQVNKKSEWGYAIFGVLSYYLSALLGGVILAVGSEVIGYMSIDEMDDTVLGLIAVPFGILGCWATYKLLEKIWAARSSNGNSEILDNEFV